MRVRIAIALLVAGLVAGCSDSQTPTAPSPTAQTFSLSGHVFRDARGVPFSNAAITILDGPNAGKSTVAIADGTFILSGLVPSGFTVRASFDGYDQSSEAVTLTGNRTVDFVLARRQIALGGNWGGTLTMKVDGRAITLAMAADIIHTGQTVSLTFRTSPGTDSGTITGTLSTPFSDAVLSGSLTFDSASADPAIRCHGTAQISGPVQPTMILTSPIMLVPNCSGVVSDVTVTLRR